MVVPESGENYVVICFVKEGEGSVGERVSE